MVREALTSQALGALSPGEAAALLVARRAEGLTGHEETLLADWLAADQAHRAAFESADRGWRVFEDADNDELLAAMRAHALAARRPVWTGWRGIAAAGVVLAIGGGSIAFIPGLNPWAPGPEQTAPAIVYASARGEVKEIALADGGVMTLDADSAATVSFTAKERSVRLERGRAFFTVTHDAARPFIVAVADRRVVDIGTRFDVDLAAGTVTVTLLEGSVAIGPLDQAAEPVMLRPGEQYVRRLGRATVRPTGGQARTPGGWRQGLVNFDDQPLAEAVAVMNRYSTDQIVIHDPRVAALRVSGQFRPGEADRFAQTLAELHRLKAVRRGAEIELE